VDALSSVKNILARLESLKNPKNIEGMKRFGITPKQSYGVNMPVLRALGKELGKDHVLAQELWAIDTRETRILASLVDEKDKVTEDQMELWVKAFSYWEIVDQVIINLFEHTPFAFKKALEWSMREPEFERRAGFVLIARIAGRNKTIERSELEPFIPLIVKGSTDERAGVKKAVNWALREFGKRDPESNKVAIEVAKRILMLDSKAARWVASDALRELRSENVRKRLEKKAKKI
jgi:3-methyladenine DNA glycosylase AlkD